jgi:hypothetical protein
VRATAGRVKSPRDAARHGSGCQPPISSSSCTRRGRAHAGDRGATTLPAPSRVYGRWSRSPAVGSRSPSTSESSACRRRSAAGCSGSPARRDGERRQVEVVRDVVGIRHDVAHGADEQRAFAARSVPKNVRDDVEGEARHFRRDGDRLPVWTSSRLGLRATTLTRKRLTTGEEQRKSPSASSNPCPSGPWAADRIRPARSPAPRRRAAAPRDRGSRRAARPHARTRAGGRRRASRRAAR